MVTLIVSVRQYRVERVVSQLPDSGGGYDIVMLVLNDVAHDSRVQREAAALGTAGWRVLVIGTQRAEGTRSDREQLHGFTVQRVRYARLGTGLWWPWRRVRHLIQAAQVVRAVRHNPARAYHAHDLPALLLLSVARIGKRERLPLIYDSHELYLFQPRPATRGRRGWNRFVRPVMMRIEGKLARRATRVITVSLPMARVMRAWYGVRRPVVVRNIPPQTPDGHLSPVDLRRVAGDARWIIVHSGEITDQGRCLTELVKAMVLLPNEVALVFVGEGEAQAGLMSLAQRLTIADRVHFLPPVSPNDLTATLRGADAAAVLLRPDSYHIRATLPNKLFEAVAAGLPVVASDVWAVRQVAQAHDLGMLCDPTDPEEIAAAFRVLLTETGQARFRAQVRNAQAILSWDAEAERLRAVYRELLG